MRFVSLFAVFPLCMTAQSWAAALERSNQSISGFLESGNYAEISYAQIHSDLQGEVQHQQEIGALGITDFSTGNLVRRDHIYNATVKFQIQPKISVGLILDQPYKARLNYNYSPTLSDGSILPIESAKIIFKSNSLTSLLGYQPNEAWNIYTGLSLQSFEGDILLEGQYYDGLNGYHSIFDKDYSPGWLLGISYQIPEIALRASLTYRSKIKYKLSTEESTAYSNGQLHLADNKNTFLETPQSVNLDFQTGISPQNLFYGGVRWVNWQDFIIQPPQFNAVMYYASLDPRFSNLGNTQLISYEDDQWSARLGFAHMWNKKWLSFIEGSWDSGTNNPASTFNPADGYYGLGLGVQYTFNVNTFLALAYYHIIFNKPPISPPSNGTQIASLSSVTNDNYGQLFGLRLGHRF